MKIIAVNRKPGYPITSVHAIELYPDSAPTASGKPLFLPDFCEVFRGVVAPAYRISRLGKEIQPRFASRYYDALTLALRIFPENSPIMPNIARPDIIKGFDGSIVLGSWQPLGQPGEPLSVTHDLQPMAQLPAAKIDIDNVIASVAAFMTLKMGDIIIPCYIDTPVELPVGLKTDFSIAPPPGDTPPCLRIKIK